MMPYKGFYLRLFSLLLKKPMKEEYGKERTQGILKGVPSIYRELLEKVEDIGADNPMAPNIYECFVFLAIWKAGANEFSIESLRRVAKTFMTRGLIPKVAGSKNINRQKDLASVEKAFHANQKWVDEHPQYQDKT